MDTYLAIASKRDWKGEYADRPLREDVVTRILDSGRLAGSAANRQPWTFLVVEDAAVRENLAETVYVGRNVREAPLVVAVAVRGGEMAAFDGGRAVQNMLLAAWNEGVVSSPNGMPDTRRTADVLGLGEDERPLIVLSFGYPRRPVDASSRTAEEWSARARRKPLDEVVRRR